MPEVIISPLSNITTMKKAIKDLWYMFAVWMVMRLNPISAGEMLELWGKVLQDKPRFED